MTENKPSLHLSLCLKTNENSCNVLHRYSLVAI